VLSLSTAEAPTGVSFVSSAGACCHAARPPRREGTGRNRRGGGGPGARPPTHVRPGSNMPSSLRDAINSRMRGRPTRPGERPRTPEGVLREAMGLPATGPLTPEQQDLLDGIYTAWEAIARGELPEFNSDDSTLGQPAPSNWSSIGPTPQHVIDRENMIAANRARERELQDWRWWIISKTGGFLVGQAGGGYIGAAVYNEVMSDPASDPNTAGERADGKIKGDVAGDVLGAGAGYVAGRVADRFLPGSREAVGAAVDTTVSQVMGDQIENGLKDKYRRQREAAGRRHRRSADHAAARARHGAFDQGQHRQRHGRRLGHHPVAADPGAAQCRPRRLG